MAEYMHNIVTQIFKLLGSWLKTQTPIPIQHRDTNEAFQRVEATNNTTLKPCDTGIFN